MEHVPMLHVIQRVEFQAAEPRPEVLREIPAPVSISQSAGGFQCM
jgi:hypothetical protein